MCFKVSVAESDQHMVDKGLLEFMELKAGNLKVQRAVQGNKAIYDDDPDPRLVAIFEPIRSLISVISDIPTLGRIRQLGKRSMLMREIW